MRKCYDPPSHLSTGENGNWNRWVWSITFLIIISFSVTQSKVHISIRVKIFTQFTEKIKCDLHKFSVLFLHNPKAYTCLFYEYECRTNWRFVSSIQICCRYFWLHPVKSVIVWPWKISYHNGGCGRVEADRNTWLGKMQNA